VNEWYLQFSYKTRGFGKYPNIYTCQMENNSIMILWDTVFG
jgi:hypothetical protein